MLRKTVRFARDAYRYLAFRHGQCRGVYKDFRQAEAAAPRGRKLGYNHAAVALKFQDELNLELDSSDYPVLFHMTKIIDDCHTVLDFGGNIGTHYLRYKNYLNLDNVEWVIWDFPEIVQAGVEICSGVQNVRFIDAVDQLQTTRIDVLHASGSIQYLAAPGEFIRTLEQKGLRPRHILIDQVPLYGGPNFVTLQSGGLTCYPQHVFNRTQFIAGIEILGYRLADSWSCVHYSCRIPFHADKSVHTYSGVYFSE